MRPGHVVDRQPRPRARPAVPHRAGPARSARRAALARRRPPQLRAGGAGDGEPVRHHGRRPADAARGLRGDQPPRLPRMAARARHRPRGARVTDPAGHVRPRLRLRGRRSRPSPLQRRARAGAGDQDAPRVLGSAVLEDAGGDGRGDLRSPLRGPARPRGGVPLLPPGRRAPTERRRAVDRRDRPGHPGRGGRRRRRLRSPDPGEGPPVLARRAPRRRSCGPPMRSTGSTSSRSGPRAATSVAAPWRRGRTSTPWCSPSPSAWCRTSAASSWRRRPPGGRWSTTWGRWPRRPFQLWLSEDEQALGWSGPPGVTVSGFVTPFDTWASMSHLLPAEDWPEADRPRTIAYFCSVLETPDARDGAPDVEAETRAVRARARTFLDRDVATLWPAAVDATDSGGPCCATARPGPRPAPSDSTASTGGRTSTPPTSTSSPCPAPTSTACSRATPASATSPWPATGRTTA